MIKLQRSDYTVTKDGRVLSPNGEVKQTKTSYGYLVVDICGHQERVHRLVAMEFIENPEKLHLQPVGEKSHLSKLSDNDVRVIRSLIGKMSGSEIARQFNVTRGLVSKIKTGNCWRYA